MAEFSLWLLCWGPWSPCSWGQLALRFLLGLGLRAPMASSHEVGSYSPLLHFLEEVVYNSCISSLHILQNPPGKISRLGGFFFGRFLPTHSFYLIVIGSSVSLFPLRWVLVVCSFQGISLFPLSYLINWCGQSFVVLLFLECPSGQ